MTRGVAAALIGLAVSFMLAVLMTGIAIYRSVSPAPLVPTDPRFPAFQESVEDSYTVAVDATVIRGRFAPLGINDAISVAAHRGSGRFQWLPSAVPQYWYHAVVHLSPESQRQVAAMPSSPDAQLPAIHPELFDDVPLECSLKALTVPGNDASVEEKQAFQAQFITDDPHLHMWVNAAAFCPELGILIVEAEGTD